MWCYFPASGLRWRETGELWTPGLEGDSWSSSSGAGGSLLAGYIYLNEKSINPLSIARRDYAFPVRCVQELTCHSISSEIFCSIFKSGVLQAMSLQ